MQKLGSSMDFGQEAILGLAGDGLPDLSSALPEAAASLPQVPSAKPAKAAGVKSAGSNDLMPPPALKAIYDRVAAEERVPVNVLVAMGHTESRHRADIDGPQTKYGAAGGIMQYLPGMAAAHKINRYNPEESIRQAAIDLRERLAKNKGDMANAVARHHAGDNPQQLGPKSREYAETILAKARRLAPIYEAEQAAMVKDASKLREASREQAAEDKRREYYPAGGAKPAAGTMPSLAGNGLFGFGEQLQQARQAAPYGDLGVMNGFNAGSTPAAQERSTTPVTPEAEAEVRAALTVLPAGQREALLQDKGWRGQVARTIWAKSERAKKLQHATGIGPKVGAPDPIITRDEIEASYQKSGYTPDQAAQLAMHDLAGHTDQVRASDFDFEGMQAARDSLLVQAGRDVKRGASNLRAMSEGLAGTVYGLMGADDAARSALEVATARMERTARENPALIGSYENIHGADDAIRYAVEAVAENLPMFVPSLASGGAGGLAARKAAQGIVSDMVAKVGRERALKELERRIMIGQVTGAATASVGMETGSIAGDIYQKTGRAEPWTALAGGIPAGLLDTIEPVMALRKIAGPVADGVAGSIIKRLGVESGKQFMAEAGTEGLQTIIENAAVLSAQNKQPLTPELLDGVVDAMLKGGIGGGVMGAGSEAVSGLRHDRRQPALDYGAATKAAFGDPLSPQQAAGNAPSGPIGRAVSKAQAAPVAPTFTADDDLDRPPVDESMFVSQEQESIPPQPGPVPTTPAWGHQPAAELAGRPVEVGRKENFAADYPVPPAPDADAIADVDARVAAAREQASAAQRRQILDGVLSDSAVRNPVAKFAAELARAGYAQAMPSPAELATIERFSSAKDAFSSADPDVSLQEPAAPNEMGNDEAADWRAQRDAEIMPGADASSTPSSNAGMQKNAGEAELSTTLPASLKSLADATEKPGPFIKKLRKAGHTIRDADHERQLINQFKEYKANGTAATDTNTGNALAQAQPAGDTGRAERPAADAQPGRNADGSVDAGRRQRNDQAVAADGGAGKQPASVKQGKNWHAKAKEVDLSRDTVRDAVARLGGIRKDEAMREWGATLVEGTKSRIFGKPVFRAKGGTGMSLDKMREALAELGYLQADSDINDLYEAFEQDGLHHVGQERRAAAMAQDAATEGQAVPAGEAAAAMPERTLDNHPVYDPWYDFDPDAILPDDLNEAAASAGEIVGDEDAEMFEAITTRLHQVLGADEAEAITERAAIMADSGKNFFEAVLELINGRQEAESNTGAAEPAAEGGKAAEASAGQAGARAAADIQQGQPDAGRAADEPSQPGSDDAGILQSYDQAELDAREQAQRAAESRRQGEERAADRKRQADAEVNDFVLTGSDTMADQLAARGQGGLFDDAASDTSPKRVDNPAENRHEPTVKESLTADAPETKAPYPGKTELQQRKAFGKALSYTGYEGLDGRRNPQLGTAVYQGDAKKALSLLAASKSPVISQVANLAKRIDGLKVAVDESAMEEDEVDAKFSRDTYTSLMSKAAVAVLDKLRQAADTLDAKDWHANDQVLREQVAEYRDFVDALDDNGSVLPAEKRKQSGDSWRFQLGNAVGAITGNSKTYLSVKDALADMDEWAGDNERTLRSNANVHVSRRTAVAGSYNAQTKTVTAVSAYHASSEHVIAHELVHALTAEALANPNEAQQEVVRRLGVLFNHVRKALPGSQQYGLKSLTEFVAEGLSNPSFQYDLATVPYKRTTAWGKFTQFIAELVGIRHDTAFHELLALTEELASKDILSIADTPGAQGRQKPTVPSTADDAHQSRLSNEPTASAASRIPAASGQANASTVKSDGEAFEFPTQQIADSYRHISHRGSDSAKAEEDAFNQSVEQIRSEVGAMVQTEAQQAAFDSAMAEYQRGYIDASLKVARAREGTMSPLVAGRNNFNGKQAARTGGAYEKAQDEFSRKVGRLKAAVEEAVRDAKTPEQIQAEQHKAAEKARNKSILDFAKAAGTIADDLRNDRKAMAGDTRKWANKDMMALLDGMDEATQRQAIEGSDKALKELGGLVVVVGPRSALGRRITATLARATEDGDQPKGDSIFPEGAHLSVAGVEAEASPVIDQLDAARGESMATAQSAPATDEGGVDAGVSRNDRSESGEARRISVEDARAIIGRIIANVHARSTERVRVIPSIAMLPPQIRQWLDNEVNEQDHNVPAVYWDGNTYIIAENLRSEAHLEEALLHELMGHYGVRVLFGAETDVRMRQLFDDIGGWKGYLDIAEALGLKDRLMPYYLDYKDSRRLNFVMMDELLGHMAGLNKWPTRQLHALIGRLKDYLRRLGFAHLPNYTISDLAHILTQARGLVIAGDDRANPVENPQRASLGAASIPALTVSDLQDVFRQSPLGSWVDRLIASGRLTIKPSLVLPEGYKHLEATQAFTVDGKITMFAGNIGGRQRVMPVLLHEVFHSSGEALLGGKEWGKLIAELDQLRQHAEANPAGKAGKLWGGAKRRVQQAIDNGDNMTRADMAEELGAYAIELADQAPLTWQRWVDRLLGHVKAWARRVFGVQLGRLTPEQLRALAIAALRDGATTASPGPRLSMQDKETISMKEGNFPGAESDTKEAAVAAGREAQRMAAESPVSARQILKDMGLKYFPHGMKMMHGDAIIDIYKKDLPALQTLARMMERQSGDRQLMQKEAGETFKKWASLPAAVSDRLADLMHEATIWQLHPDKEAPPNLTKQWQKKHVRLAADWAALPDDAKAVYQAVRDLNEKRTEQMFSALENRIKRVKALSESQRAGMLQELRARFDKTMGEGPYFPLSRDGDYLVVAKKHDDTGKEIERIVLSSETLAEQESTASDLKQRGFDDVRTTSRSSVRTQGSSGSDLTQFAAHMIGMLDDIDMSPEQRTAMLDDINQMLIDALPPASARKHFKHRKGVPGFSNDARRAFAKSQNSMANHIANINFQDQIDAALDEAQEQADAHKNSNELARVVGHMRERQQAARAFVASRLANSLAAFGYVSFLAFSASNAILNLSQIPMFTGPMLASKFGDVATASAMTAATGRVLRAAGKQASVWAQGKGRTGDALGDVRVLDDLPDDDLRILKAMEKRGKLDLTYSMEMVRAGGEVQTHAGNPKTSLGKISEPIARARRWYVDNMGILAHVTEAANRQITAIAAYRLAIDAGMSHSEAVDYTAEVLDSTQINYEMFNRPLWMMNNYGRVISMMLTFSIRTMGLLMRKSIQSFDGGAEGREARGMMARMLLSVVFFAGASGLPILPMAAAAGFAGARKLTGSRVLGAAGGAASMLTVNALLSGLLGDEDEPWDWDTWRRQQLNDLLGKDLALAADKGVIRSVLKANISDRIGMASLLYRDIDTGSGNGAAVRFMERGFIQFGGGAWLAAARDQARAYDLFAQGQTLLAVEAAAPKHAADVIKATRLAMEGVTVPVGGQRFKVGEVSGWEVAVQALGFNPDTLARRFEQRNAARKAVADLQSRRGELLASWVAAKQAKDDTERKMVEAEIDAFNKNQRAAGRSKLVITPRDRNAKLNAGARAIDRAISDEYGSGRYEQAADQAAEVFGE